jgi:AraC-like DNA-binding protein
MTYLELLPDRRLRPYVQLLWCLDLASGDGFGPVERIAADGIAELVFHYRDPMRMRFAGEDFALQPRSSLVMQTRRFVEISAGGGIGLISVRFRPWGARHFLRIPVSELADRVVPAEDLWGPAALELEERLFLARSTNERVGLVERFLLARLDERRSVEGVVRAVWRRRGDVRVSELCSELGVSERCLQRLCAGSLGMPPRNLIRLTRFLHACSLLRNSRSTPLTQIAHDCGYYDQAHFNGDVRALAGMTPGELRAATHFSHLEIDTTEP